MSSPFKIRQPKIKIPKYVINPELIKIIAERKKKKRLI
ncbi:Uncharacterised protein [Candidatus Tiddalikarchaeum anstoanum]|nr:Uncharacterised protein [Candidatus Tiddalikarchaeum anstoanum]